LLSTRMAAATSSAKAAIIKKTNYRVI
jgi:hypothetical protein